MFLLFSIGALFLSKRNRHSSSAANPEQTVPTPKINASLKIEILDSFAGWVKSNNIAMKDAVCLFVGRQVTPLTGRPLSCKKIRLYTVDSEHKEIELSLVSNVKIKEMAPMSQGDLFHPRWNVEQWINTDIGKPIPDGTASTLYLFASRGEDSVENVLQFSLRAEVIDVFDCLKGSPRCRCSQSLQIQMPSRTSVP
jgi:hypothetical protein